MNAWEEVEMDIRVLTKLILGISNKAENSKIKNNTIRQDTKI
jgi:hypothetical protein